MAARRCAASNGFNGGDVDDVGGVELCAGSLSRLGQPELLTCNHKGSDVKIENVLIFIFFQVAFFNPGRDSISRPIIPYISENDACVFKLNIRVFKSPYN
jgi:hypothetical protein